MKLTVNESELKKTYAYLTPDDLIKSLKKDVDFLEAHVDDYSLRIWHTLQGISAFIKNIELDK